MKLPLLDEQIKSKETTEEFSGYCNKPRINNGQWQNMKNMTNDYYPLLSTRHKRSLQFANAPNTVSITDENENSEDYTAYGCEGVQFVDGSLYVLKKLKNSSNEDEGCVFIKNGEDFTSDDVSKASYFDNSGIKRSLVRMGSDICVFPDGVVFESANTEEEAPLTKIDAEKTLDDFLVSTVYKNSSNEYIDICDYSDGFRVDENGVSQYLSDSALWVSRQTYIKISALSSENAFAMFNENDSLIVKTTGAPGMHGDVTGTIFFKKDDVYDNPNSIKIIEKGWEEVNGDVRDYIITNGYVYFEPGNKAYLNASEFEIRQNMFGKYQSEYGILITLKRKTPDIKLACEAQNRIWACSKDGHEIYASALANPYNFYDFSGLATDSYAVSVGTQGEFTACINYLGHPLFFKENAVHIISGSYPSNAGEMDAMSYSVTTVTDFKGVEKGSENSLAIIDNILYYKSSSGIVAYDGTNTAIISDALGKERYKNAVAGAYNNKYFVSMQDSKGESHLFVYDTRLSTWCREDNTSVFQFMNIKNELLYVNSDDEKIYSVSDEDILNFDDFEEEGAFDWECESGNIGYSYPNNKYISRLQLRLQLQAGARAAVYVQYDSDGNWLRKGEINAKGIKTHLIPIVPVRCDHMKFKLKGRGDMKLISIARILEEGGDGGC